MTKSQRSKIRYAPPALSVHARLLLAFLRVRDHQNWPVGEAVRAAGLSEGRGYAAAERLLQLGLVERASEDSFIRIRVTPRGRRVRIPPPPRPGWSDD